MSEQVNVTVDNVRPFRRELSKYAPDVKKALDKANREAGAPLIALAKAQIQGTNMSNYGRWISKKDGRDLSWNPSAATSGIKIKQQGRAKGSPWAGVLQLRNESAVGAIYELAGRKGSPSTPQGGKFIENLQNIQNVSKKGISRVIWRAIVLFPARRYTEIVVKNYDEAQKELQKRLDDMKPSVNI